MIRICPQSQLFPHYQGATWIKSGSKFKQTFRLTIHDYLTGLSNLEGIVLRQEVIPIEAVRSAWVLAMGDMADPNVWIADQNLQPDILVPSFESDTID